MGFSSVPVLVLEFFCCPNCLYVKVVWLRLTSSQHRGIALLAALPMRQNKSSSMALNVSRLKH